MAKIRIFLPAYNEENTLPSLLSRFERLHVESKLDLEVTVVNDGSKDSTPDIVRNYRGNLSVNLVDLQPNRGLAGAMKAGFKEVVNISEDNDIIVALDADDSQNPFLINRMVQQINEGSDIVIASRYRDGARVVGLTRFRELTSIGAGLLFILFINMRGVRDYTCGFRAYKASLLKKALQYYGDRFIEEQGFSCMAEILLKLNRFKPIIHELPMILRYDLKIGASKMNVLKTVRQTLNLLLSYHLSSRFK
jgi:dolichol-phosphate mannosyltransferase